MSEETKFKVGDIVETNCVYRIVGASLRRIPLSENIQLEIVKTQKTATHSASYCVKNLKTGNIEDVQYWEDELWRAWGDR